MVKPQLLMCLCGEATKIQKHSIFDFLKYLRGFYFCSAPFIGSGNLILVNLGFLPPTSSWPSKFKGAEACLRHGGKGMICVGPSPIHSSTCCLIWPLSITPFISGLCRDLSVLTWFIGMLSILASAAVCSSSLSQGHLGPAGSVHQIAFSSSWGCEECPTAVLHQRESWGSEGSWLKPSWSRQATKACRGDCFHARGQRLTTLATHQTLSGKWGTDPLCL